MNRLLIGLSILLLATPCPALEEGRCEAIGELTKSMVIARDRGVPMSKLFPVVDTYIDNAEGRILVKRLAAEIYASSVDAETAYALGYKGCLTSE